jgi:hypothetical protein
VCSIKIKQSDKVTALVALVTVGTIGTLFVFQGHIGFNITDEGWLWYGVQRVMLGEVPIRDFMSYDPGRYYWSAGIMELAGDNGIMALRVAVAIFQAFGFFIGLVLLARSSTKPDYLLCLIAALTFAAWMYPRHKLFDISVSIMLIGALSFLIRHPSGRRYFFTGLCVGLAAVFGRNHGVYGLAGSLGVMAYLAVQRELGPRVGKAFTLFGGGVVVGYLPVLLMIATVPGFMSAFWESILFLFEIKATNLPRPVPWPWTVPFGQVTLFKAIKGALVGLFFIAIVAFGVLGLVWSLRQRLQRQPVPPVFAASVFLMLPYAHYAYSRAGVGHLALGIFPFLVGCFGLLVSCQPKIKWPLAALLCGASLCVMLLQHPGPKCHTSQQCLQVEVAGDKLEVNPNTARDLALLNQLANEYAPEGRKFIAAPIFPGAYAALGRKSPMDDTYAMWPRSDTFQQAEIEKIKAADPGFVLIRDHPIDGRDELRFRNTHPMIDQYIRDHFEPITGYTQNPEYQLYKSKRAVP